MNQKFQRCRLGLMQYLLLFAIGCGGISCRSTEQEPCAIVESTPEELNAVETPAPDADLAVPPQDAVDSSGVPSPATTPEQANQEKPEELGNTQAVIQKLSDPLPEGTVVYADLLDGSGIQERELWLNSEHYGRIWGSFRHAASRFLEVSVPELDPKTRCYVGIKLPNSLSGKRLLLSVEVQSGNNMGRGYLALYADLPDESRWTTTSVSGSTFEWVRICVPVEIPEQNNFLVLLLGLQGYENFGVIRFRNLQMIEPASEQLLEEWIEAETASDEPATATETDLPEATTPPETAENLPETPNAEPETTPAPEIPATPETPEPVSVEPETAPQHNFD